MINKVKYSLILLVFVIVSILLIKCDENRKNDNEKNKLDKEYISELLLERASKDSAFQYESHSPFARDPKARFSPLKYFDPTSEFIFKSKLYEYEPKDTVDVYGTRGELRRVIKEGYIILDYKEDEFKINVYKGFGKNGEPYHSIWFTDKTTGKETYGVGRYLNFEKEESTDHNYTIDFNRAYNPYCAYSALFTCPIPREEDYIDISILAGEKNFH